MNIRVNKISFVISICLALLFAQNASAFNMKKELKKGKKIYRKAKVVPAPAKMVGIWQGKPSLIGQTFYKINKDGTGMRCWVPRDASKDAELNKTKVYLDNNKHKMVAKTGMINDMGMNGAFLRLTIMTGLGPMGFGYHKINSMPARCK